MRLGFVMAFSALLAGGPATAFGTINSLGQNAEHEKITRAAFSTGAITLAPMTLDKLAGKTGSFGAVGMPDRTPRLITQASAHCDGGDFLGADVLPQGAVYPQTAEAAQQALIDCQTWVFQNFDSAVALAAPLAKPDAANTALKCSFSFGADSAKCQVLTALGRSMHAVQDFYSHTNWVDQPDASKPISADNPDGLGFDNPANFMSPYSRSKFNTAMRGKLISGCFTMKPEAAFCNYGGLSPRARVKHLALNKDTGPIGPKGATGPGTTPRGMINGNFERAVAAAILDTGEVFGQFEYQVQKVYGEEAGRRIACAVREDDPSKCAEKPKAPKPRSKPEQAKTDAPK